MRRELGDGLEHIAEIGVAVAATIALPTARNTTSAPCTPSRSELRKCMRPAATLRATSSSSPAHKSVSGPV